MDVRPVAKRISQYFADFISTDFKRKSAPRRRIQLTTETGLRSGMRVSNYPELDRDLWSVLSQRIEDTRALVVKPRKYTRSISQVLRKVIQEHVLAIREADVHRVLCAPRAIATVHRATRSAVDPSAYALSCQALHEG